MNFSVFHLVIDMEGFSTNFHGMWVHFSLALDIIPLSGYMNAHLAFYWLKDILFASKFS